VACAFGLSKIGVSTGWGNVNDGCVIVLVGLGKGDDNQQLVLGINGGETKIAVEGLQLVAALALLLESTQCVEAVLMVGWGRRTVVAMGVGLRI
jgi:hypothetical protein